MKRLSFLLATFALSGCAGLVSGPGTVLVPDSAKIAAVERAAAQSGVKVYWINTPLKAVPAAGS